VSTWVPLVAAIVGAGGMAGLGGSIIGGLMQRPKTKADAVKVLTDAAQQLVNEMQEEARAARAEAVEARAEVAAARKDVRLLTGELETCMAKVRAWKAAILSPSVSREQLHRMVGAEPGQNGRGG
jgi:hypothetical protein